MIDFIWIVCATILFSTVGAPIMLLIVLLTIFGQVYSIVFLVSCFGVFSVYHKLFKDANRAKNMLLLFSIFFTVLFWASFALSSVALPFVQTTTGQDLTLPVATSGFPFRTFYYPFPSMGNDQIPAQSWLPFYLNYAVYFAVTFVITQAIYMQLRKKESFLFSWKPRTTTIALLAVLVCNLVQVGFLLLKFD